MEWWMREGPDRRDRIAEILHVHFNPITGLSDEGHNKLLQLATPRYPSESIISGIFAFFGEPNHQRAAIDGVLGFGPASLAELETIKDFFLPNRRNGRAGEFDSNFRESYATFFHRAWQKGWRELVERPEYQTLHMVFTRVRDDEHPNVMARALEAAFSRQVNERNIGLHIKQLRGLSEHIKGAGS